MYLRGLNDVKQFQETSKRYGRYRARPTGERSGFDAQSQQSEMALEIIAPKQLKHADNVESTLTHGQSHSKSKTEGTGGPTK